MARSYSEDFLLDLHKLDPKRLGVQLAKLCVEANLPALYVAKAFKVSRMTVHSWFRGQYIRDKNCKRIEIFMDLVRQGLDQGHLPASNLKKAREYIEINITDSI